MGLPTKASISVEIDAPASAVYDLISDVTRSGEWSPECRSCEWVDGEPGTVGATFKGRNKAGPARWTTTARVLRADGRVFEFATLFRDEPATRWRYEVSGDQRTTLTESFDALRAPWIITMAERLFLRNRQQQLEAGVTASLERIKAIAQSG
jgi:hypothetical protein